MVDTAHVLVVDGTTLHRNVIISAMQTFAGADVVGSAPTGALALKGLLNCEPDFVILDATLPDMDSLEVLRQIRQARPDAGVVITCDGSAGGADIAVRALTLGALEIVAKQSRAGGDADAERLRADLKRLIDAFLTQRLMQKMAAERGIVAPSAAQEAHVAPSASVASPTRSAPVEVVAIGISTGGPKALGEVVPQFAASFPVPILVVQHMPVAFTKALSKSLASRSAIRVLEGQDGLPLEKGVIYIAPGGRQMKVAEDDGQKRLVLTDDAPENHCRPSADYLFRSVAEVYGHAALGVVMTGMGADGREGLRAMKARGARTMAQDEATSLVFGMPMEAIKAGVVDEVVPLGSIAEVIGRVVGHAA